MTLNEPRKKKRDDLLQAALNDVAWMMETAEGADEEDELSGLELVTLLEKNFRRLDPNSNGITKEELLSALATPDAFTEQEHSMLRLLCRYFEDVINLSDDEEGPETRISQNDFEVLSQFLVLGNLSLSGLHRWLSIGYNTQTEQEIGPPPLSSDE